MYKRVINKEHMYMEFVVIKTSTFLYYWTLFDFMLWHHTFLTIFGIVNLLVKFPLSIVSIHNTE